MTIARDGCVVPTEPLAEMLRGFVSSWDREPMGGRFAGKRKEPEVKTTGAVRWLAEESGVKEDTIWNVVSARSRTTTLSIADALVTAIGRPDVLADGVHPTNAGGTLEIRANPHATAEARARCCGGSLTGSGSPG